MPACAWPRGPSRARSARHFCLGRGGNSRHGLAGGGSGGAAAAGILMMMGAWGAVAGAVGVALFSTKVVTVIAATPSPTAVPTTQRISSLLPLWISLRSSCKSALVAKVSSLLSMRASLSRVSCAKSSSLMARLFISPLCGGPPPPCSGRHLSTFSLVRLVSARCVAVLPTTRASVRITCATTTNGTASH